MVAETEPRHPAARAAATRFERALAESRRVARESFEGTAEVFADVASALARYESALAATEDDYRAMTDSHDAELRATLAPLFEEKRGRVQRRHRELLDAHDRREASLDSFAVMLFGKTGAGKSTTIEALTEGSGQSIGDGGPDFTRDVRKQGWRGLDLIDTPGLMGFRPELRGIAESLIDQTDLIAMVVSDDSIEPKLFQRMREVRGQNKRLVILLNVKGANRDLLDHRAETAYDEREIGELREHIRGHVAEHLAEDDVPIIPFCANVAFEATRTADPVERGYLWRHSRIEEVISYLTELVEQQGLPIRATAAYDSMCHFTQSIAEETELEMPGLERQAIELRRKRTEAVRVFERLRHELSGAFADLKQHFLEVEGKLDLVAEAVLAGEQDARGAFEATCRWDDVQTKAGVLQATALERIRLGLDRFRDVLTEDLCVAADLASLEVDAIDIDAGALAASSRRTTIGKLVRLVGVPAVRIGGWIVAFFTDGLGAYAGEVVAPAVDRFGRWLEESGQSARKRLHQSLRDRMRAHLWSNHARVARELEAWLSRTLDPIRDSVVHALAEWDRATTALLSAARALALSLHAARRRLTFLSYDALLRSTHPAFRAGGLRLIDATQWMHYRAKLVVPAGSKGLVIGKEARHTRALRAHTGNAIDIIQAGTAGQIDEEFVAQALRPAVIGAANVSLGDRILVRPAPDEVGKAYGRGRRNLMLAAELAGRPITVVDGAPQGGRTGPRGRRR